MPPQQTNLIYEFGDFELHALRRVLVTRADTQQVEISGRVLEALVFLVERAGQLVEKRALIEALWPHVVVEEGSLTQTIHTLRKALGEKPGEHRYIATVPGRGYRFVAEVSVRSTQAAPAGQSAQGAPAVQVGQGVQTAHSEAAQSVRLAAPAQSKIDSAPSRDEPALTQSKTEPAVSSQSRVSKQALAGSALAVLILIGIALWLLRGREQPVEGVSARTGSPPSIAVLAFVDMSAEQDQAHFAEGLSEEILNLLAKSENLLVIARTSSFSFKSQNVDVQSIAKRLDVTHVLEGSVRKSGEKVRITAQLIDAANSAHLWSETYDRDMEDVFGVQTEIASAVAQSLKVKLVGGDAPRPAETTSTKAYEHYLQGRHLFHRRATEDLPKARAHFEEATQLDPAFARAWAALAGVYFVSHHEAPEMPDAASKWREAAQRAVALAPDLAEANVRAAQYYWLAGGDPQTANVHMARASAIDPTDPLVISMSVSRAILQGRIEDAIGLQQQLVATDPVSATQRANLGMLFMVAGRLDEARSEMERSLELSSASEVTAGNIASVLILQKRTDEALKVIRQLPAGSSRDQYLALVAFARGDVVEGDAMLSRLLPVAAASGRDFEVAVEIAELYAIKNDRDLAFQWLETARERAYSIGGATLLALKTQLRVAPFLKPLHTDPRWTRLLTSIDEE